MSARALASVVLVLAAGLVVVPTAPAVSDVSPADPTDPTTPRTAAAKALPTTQINGVAWDQEVIGNTVYVAGEFTAARPAGAAPGVNEVRRSNLLAYDIRTGVLSTTWAPRVNAAVNDIEASPDGSRLYVGGNFTTVNGVTHRRIAALDARTGALIRSFAPNPNGNVYAVAPTSTSVYFGGVFGSVQGTTRARFAAARASDGALLDWAPAADRGYPWALKLSPDGKQVLAGGSFTSLNGSTDPGLGLASIDAVTGALRPWEANRRIRNDGARSGAITSIETDGRYAYASGATYSRRSNLEGIAKMDWDGGRLVWLEDCHGDTLDTHPDGDVVYAASHAHYCGNLPGGFHQPKPQDPRRATAFTARTTDTLRAEYLGYFDWAGTPAPSLLHWFPTISSGTYTGQGQGAWDVDGNADYVVYGGEFPQVGGTGAQGLVRFSKDPPTGESQPPSETPGALTPRVRSTGAGQVQVSWRSSWDQDSERLTYEVVRNDAFASPIHTRTVSSDEWDRPFQAYVDTGATPGSVATYRVVVRDQDGHQIRSNPVSVNVASSGSMDPYARAVMADGPQNYWRFTEQSGTTVGDQTGRDAATVTGTPTRNVPGAVGGDPAITLDGSSNQRMYASTAAFAPFWYTVEAWFRTRTTRGGKIVGFGTSQTGESSSTESDHTLYMDDSGRIHFGSRQGGNHTVGSATGLNDGQWHHAVGVQAESGMSLYVDGVRVAHRSDVRVGMSRSGWWRVGGDNLAGWPSRPSSDHFAGSVDEVAVYHHPLSTRRVREHHQASQRAVPDDLNQQPHASFTSGVTGLTVEVDASASSDDDGAIVSYAWSWGDGTPGRSRQRSSHTYAAPGTYPVKLTVTDDEGAKATTTRNVTVAAPRPRLADQRQGVVMTPQRLPGPKGATYSVTAGSLPPGLALARDGVLSGKPTKWGTYVFQVSATASATTKQVEYSLRVVDPDLPGARVGVPAAASRATHPVTGDLRQTVTWTGADATSGVAAYDVRFRRAPWNGAFQPFVVPAPRSASRQWDQRLLAGGTYCWSARATDRSGRTGAWSPERCTVAPLPDGSLTRAGGWSRVSGSDYLGGSAVSTRRKGATLSKAGARLARVGVVATTCPTCGAVDVLVGSKRIGRISLARGSATRHRRPLLLPRFTTRTGKVTVKVVTSARMVRVDGLVVGAR